MNLLESFRIAMRGLASNKLRAALTMLGIIIGVGAVITLLSVGEGVQAFITEQFEGIGTNLLFVIPNFGDSSGFISARRTATRSSLLTLDDARALDDPFRVPDAVAVVPETQNYVQVVVGNRYANTFLYGTTADYPQVRNFYPIVGTFITEQDVERATRTVVLGQTVVEALFPDQVYPVGRSVEINGVRFQIVGIMEEKGESGPNDQDDIIFAPLTTVRRQLFRRRNQQGDYLVDVIYVQASSDKRMDAATQQIAEVLRERHDISFRDEDDFYVFSQEEILDIFNQITDILTIFLGAIAGISLLVGGIGIMNIMLVSVTERTREIGLRKAVGARRRDILTQFLVEAVTLSIIGGFFGILLGAVGSWGISTYAQNAGEDFRAVISMQAVLIATFFSAAVGLFFGIYPARRASRLNPIDALRYE
jgi:putative ABC transport system permease protein